MAQPKPGPTPYEMKVAALELAIDLAKNPNVHTSTTVDVLATARDFETFLQQ